MRRGIASGCGVATLSISYYDLGYTTGEMAYEISGKWGRRVHYGH